MIIVLGSIIDGVLPTVTDPRVIGDPARLLKLLHGDEEIVWSGVVRPGDVLTTSATVDSSGREEQWRAAVHRHTAALSAR